MPLHQDAVDVLDDLSLSRFRQDRVGGDQGVGDKLGAVNLALIGMGFFVDQLDGALHLSRVQDGEIHGEKIDLIELQVFPGCHGDAAGAEILQGAGEGSRGLVDQAACCAGELQAVKVTPVDHLGGIPIHRQGQNIDPFQIGEIEVQPDGDLQNAQVVVEDQETAELWQGQEVGGSVHVNAIFFNASDRDSASSRTEL